MYKHSFANQFIAGTKAFVLAGLCVFAVSAPVMSEAAVKKSNPKKVVQRRAAPKKVVSKTKALPKQADARSIPGSVRSGSYPLVRSAPADFLPELHSPAPPQRLHRPQDV